MSSLSQELRVLPARKQGKLTCYLAIGYNLRSFTVLDRFGDKDGILTETWLSGREKMGTSKAN